MGIGAQMMRAVAHAHRDRLVCIMALLSMRCSAFTETTTPIPGSCTPPSLNHDVDISACAGLIPPVSCAVTCAVGYAGSSVTYHCYSADDGFIGSGPVCAPTAVPTPAPTSAPSPAATSAPTSPTPAPTQSSMAPTPTGSSVPSPAPTPAPTTFLLPSKPESDFAGPSTGRSGSIVALVAVIVMTRF